MDDLNVIDRFMSAFTRYIDSGFGLLGGDVHFLTATLIGIDITLAGLFWALGGEQDVMAKFLRKILYVGAFAFIIGQFSTLADLVFRSFAAAGVTAGGGTITADDLLKPGNVAETGFSAAWPLLQQVSDQSGPIAFFTNIATIAVLLISWALIVLAFFILAIQVFVTIIEFKLTALSGFVLVPFALWGRTSFLAERVLGAVVSSGIKIMVLAVVIGIGSSFFTEFTANQGSDPDLAKTLSMLLAALTLFGLGIFAPGIATGLVSGAPQLGAGSAVGTTLGAAGALTIVGGATVAGARMAGGAALGSVRAGTSMGSAAGTAYKLGQETAEKPTVGAGLSGVAQAAGGAARQKMSDAFGLREAAEGGRQGAWRALTGAKPTAASAESGEGAGAPPAWANAMRRQQDNRHHQRVATETLKEGDRGGAAAIPDIDEKED
jgi:type IV secretion system protein TrbL